MRSDSRCSKESTIFKAKGEWETVKAALAGNAVVREIVDYRGVPVLSVYRPIDFEGVRWAILGEIDIAEMLAPVNAMRNISALIGAAILLVVSLMSFLAARGITRPIMALTGTMGSLANGDHAVEITGAERGEIGRANV